MNNCWSSLYHRVSSERPTSYAGDRKAREAGVACPAVCLLQPQNINCQLLIPGKQQTALSARRAGSGSEPRLAACRVLRSHRTAPAYLLILVLCSVLRCTGSTAATAVALTALMKVKVAVGRCADPATVYCRIILIPSVSKAKVWQFQSSHCRSVFLLS